MARCSPVSVRVENGTLSDEQLTNGLKAIVRKGVYIPVFCAAGAHEKVAVWLPTKQPHS